MLGYAKTFAYSALMYANSFILYVEGWNIGADLYSRLSVSSAKFVQICALYVLFPSIGCAFCEWSWTVMAYDCDEDIVTALRTLLLPTLLPGQSSFSNLNI